MQLEEARKALELAGRPLPIRIDVKRLGQEGNRGGHFARGVLTGISGTQVIYKPFAHGGKEEIDNPAHINLWKSRIISTGILTEEQLMNIYETNNDQKYVLADMGESPPKFYRKGMHEFISNPSSATIYDQTANAGRSAGQVKKKWQGRLSGVENVKVISLDKAKQLVNNNDKESELEVVEAPVAKKSIEISDDMEVLMKELNAAMNSVDAAKEMLREETETLKRIQDKLVNIIADKVSSAENEL